MIIRTRFFAVPFLVLCLSSAAADESEKPLRFNFAPAVRKEIPGFTRVSAGDSYNADRGYGWLDHTGTVEARCPKNVKDFCFESAANFNIISAVLLMISGVLLRPDKPHLPSTSNRGGTGVWILSGDLGLLEYVPFEPFRVTVNGEKILRFDVDRTDVLRRFEQPVFEDDFDPARIYERDVTPRYQWRETGVEVRAGPLRVAIYGNNSDRSYLDFAGEYPITETREGPRRRFAGAINALVIAPEGLIPQIDEIETERKNNFLSKFQRVSGTPAGRTNARDYSVFFPSIDSAVFPDSFSPHEERTVRLSGSSGEFRTVTFAVAAHRDLGKTKVQVLWHDIANSPYSEIGVVRYVSQGNNLWKPLPEMILPTDSWEIKRGVTKQFWLTFKSDSKSGIHRGSIVIQPEKGSTHIIPLEFEALPFALDRPRDLALGLTYFAPAFYGAAGEEHFWKRVLADFEDMRRHNMTTVQWTGVGLDNFSRLDRLFELYRQVGFEQPIDLLEAYGLLHKLRREGHEWKSAKFHEAYRRKIETVWDWKKQSNWPALIIGFGDEFTNDELEYFGHTLAKSLKTIPGIVTGADANGHREVQLLAGIVEVLSFNEGWDGPTNINRGKRLLNRETAKRVSAAGSVPMIVNAGTDRYRNGVWLWRMLRAGVRGKKEWIYRLYSALPHAFLEPGAQTSLTYPGPKFATIPSVKYEQMRIGLDDLAYLTTLEKRLKSERELHPQSAFVIQGEQFLRELERDENAKHDAEEIRVKVAMLLAGSADFNLHPR